MLKESSRVISDVASSNEQSEDSQANFNDWADQQPLARPLSFEGLLDKESLKLGGFRG
jgi:hypothetical protein